MRPYSFDQLMQFIWPGLLISQTLYVAVQLEIADRLAKNAMTATELATASGSDPDALLRLLRMLSQLGMFAPDPAGRYRNTPMGDRLRKDHPASVRDSLVSCLSPAFWRPLGELESAIRSGSPAFDAVYGKSFFDWLAEHPAESAKFSKSMHAATVAAIPAILSACNFARFPKIVDVGGGEGALLTGILSAFPHTTGVVFDAPEVIDRATAAFRLSPLAARCQFTGGDFFQSVPPHADAYILRSILHDWTDEQAVQILRNCRQAISPRGTLLVIETLLASGPYAELMDIHMMILTGGRERSLAEYQRLLKSAGFAFTTVSHAAGLAIIEARPVPIE